MDTLTTSGYTLKNINKINVILGKNGCGKSTLLRTLEQALPSLAEFGKCKYITPERGGTLVYEASVEQNSTNDPNWLLTQRRKNQASNFREQSFAQFKKLETIVLREIERERRQDVNYTFDSYIEKINLLLDNIEIRRQDTAFKIYPKGSNNPLDAGSISSGESELISLGIECLIFEKECLPGKSNLLFLDEPDVHLHPDLQVRFVIFLQQLLANNANFRIVLATHSTAILGALTPFDDACLALMRSGQKELDFKPIAETHKRILPVFGAHPLSNIFNTSPILLVEGEDDERIWQQAVRSSKGHIRVYPCHVDSISDLNQFEKEAGEIITAVYDGGKGYSLRDRDETTGEMPDLPPIVRMKLTCRNAENLIVTNETLSQLDTNWNALQLGIEKWLSDNLSHPHYVIMNAFKESGFNRKDFDVKEIRNDLMGILGSSKPWEVLVGKAIAVIEWDDKTLFNVDGSLLTFLGEKTAKILVPKRTAIIG